MPEKDFLLTLRQKLLQLLQKRGPQNVSEMARATMQTRKSVRERLTVAERSKHVKSALRRKPVAPSGYIMVHEYWLTKEGEEWLATTMR